MDESEFLVKFIIILVDIIRILIDIIILVKIKILDFIRNIVSIKIPIISTRILINLIRKFWFIYFQLEI